MILKILKLELMKWTPRPLLWGLWSLCFTIISIFFYRLCVDYLLLSNKAITQNATNPSVLLEIVKPLSSWSVILFALLIPIFTTSAFSQEYRQQSFILWANSPLSAFRIVLGKFLCLLLFPLSLIIVESVMLLTLSFETEMNIGWLLSGALCILLICACIIALGLFISSLTHSSLAAMTLTFAATLLWMLLEWLDPFPSILGNLSQHLSLLSHSYRLLNGILLSTDLIYYVLFCVFWLVLTHTVVQYRLRNVL
jgi:ABC-2 type transport system permease protein